MAPWLIVVIGILGLAVLIFGTRVVVSSFVRRSDRRQRRRRQPSWRPSPLPSRNPASMARGSQGIGARNVRPVEEEALAPVSEEVESETPVEEEAPVPVSAKVGNITPVVKKAPALVSTEVADRVVIPRQQETYKEGHMDGNYVVRNDNEAKVIQMLHPDCKCIIPTDYEGAIETVTGCPLACPYRTVEFAELDQDMLRKRTK